jgi:hypothetical protein
MREHAGFILSVGGALVGVGGVLLAVGTVQASDGHVGVTTNWWTRAGLVLAFLGLALVILAVVLYVWRARAPLGGAFLAERQKHALAIPHQKQFQSGGATAELEVVIEDEVWHPFQYKALILEAKISVRSNARRAKRIRRRTEIRAYEDGQPAPSFDFTDIDVNREVARLERLRNPWPHTIGPEETITAWCVLAMPHRPQGGEPEYVVTIADEHGHEYSARRPARPK